MKKLLLVLVLLLLPMALAEPAREYVEWLEEPLAVNSYTDIAVPDFCIEKLGAEYDFCARQDAESGRCYIAGVRRPDAPALSEEAHCAGDGSTFRTNVWRMVDGDKVLHEFILAPGVLIYDFDQLQHLIIIYDPEVASGESSDPFPRNSSILTNASVTGRAREAWKEEHGFVPEGSQGYQLALCVHSIDTWRAGITDQPFFVYMDVEMPAGFLGERRITGDKAIALFDSEIDLGVYLWKNSETQLLVVSTSGVKALRSFDPPYLQEAGPGFDALLDAAEAALGYRPGPPDFKGKTSVRATFEWARGEDADGASFGPGSRVIEDKTTLRKLDEAFRAANFTVGNVNCPSPAFLTLEYDDGSSISLAVAVNSFDLFFHNGVHFTAGNGDEFIELFGLQGMNFHSNLN